jgi:ribose transport system ATP-binding protein
VGFELRRGEILGFAGLMGSGRTEAMRLIFGADPKDGGDLYLNGSSLPARLRSPQEAVAAGIALLTEDRKSQGLLLPWSVRRNISLPSLARGKSWDAEARDAEALSRTLDIRCSSIEQPVGELSGGNQQKVVIAKWLLRDADIFIVDEPTRGIDVGAKAEIHRLLLGLAGRGKSILVVSSDLPELMALCHRIAVLSAGRLVRTFEGPAYDADELLAAALPSAGARS